MKVIKLAFLVLFPFLVSAQNDTPLEQSNFTKLTSHSEVFNYCYLQSLKSSFIKFDLLGISAGERIIPLLYLSNGKFAEDTTKIKILIFAQQHGNEHSGKEALLMLLKNFSNGKYDSLLNYIDLIVIPQLNPDGNEKNLRRNGNNMDLNRNHLLLTEPEVFSLHKIFNKYLPEVTLDIHEYYPYSEEWIKFGAIKNYDEQLGLLTNPNVSEEIRDYSKTRILPYIKNQLVSNRYTFHEYIVGGPPNKDRIRFSTVEINDGRQSLGIYNTLSFIAEGKNGRDSLDNIKRRSTGQLLLVESLLNFVKSNKVEIKNIIANERKELIDNNKEKNVVIRMEHIGDGKQYRLDLLSVTSNKDTSVEVNNFHSIIDKHLSVISPKGYLVNKNDNKLIDWLRRHNIFHEDYIKENGQKIIKYNIKKLKKEVLEEMELYNPEIEKIIVDNLTTEDFYYIPLRQLASNLIILAFEPQSMLGIFQTDQFEYLLREYNEYPILRVE